MPTGLTGTHGSPVGSVMRVAKMVNGEEEEVHRPSSLKTEGSAMAKGLLLRCVLAAAG